ncbi:radical SAM protein [Candidatus Woesearchaeota archaeon]|nr:radical SAM protein [Candidatus Woesearchaeota archaeon]
MVRATIILTEKCNLDCSYCYVFKSNKSSCLNTIEKTLCFLGSNFDQIILSGGEPILKWDLIKRIVEWNKKRSFVGIPTNGLLLDEDKLNYAERNGINFAISIDGPNSTDRGTGVFEILKRKISLFLKFKGIVRIRMTISPNEAEKAYDNFMFFVNLGFTRLDIRPTLGCYWSNEKINSFFKNYQKIVSLVRNEGLNLKSLNKDSNENVACPKIIQEVLIDTEGVIYPCTFFLAIKNREKFKIGDVFSGLDGKAMKKISQFRKCSIFSKCRFCAPTGSCTKICLLYNLKTQKFSEKLGEQNIKLDKLLCQASIHVS